MLEELNIIRDIFKLIYELKFFKSLREVRNCSELDKRVALDYFIEVTWLKRLDKIIDAAKSGIINLDFLIDAELETLASYSEDLYKKLHWRYRICKGEEKQQEIAHLKYEINRFKNSCPNARGLGIELLEFCNFYYSEGSKQLTPMISQLSSKLSKLLQLTSYASDSPIYDFLTHKTAVYTWYQDYVFINNSEIKPAKREKGLADLINASIKKDGELSYITLTNVLPVYSAHETKIDGDTLRRLVDNTAQKYKVRRTLKLLQGTDLNLNFSPEEYFDDLFKKIDTENKDGRFPLNLVAESFITLMYLFDVEECINAFSSKIVTRPEKEELHHYVSTEVLLKRYNDSGLAEMFEESYQQANRGIAQKRADLVLVLKQIKDQKTN